MPPSETTQSIPKGPSEKGQRLNAKQGLTTGLGNRQRVAVIDDARIYAETIVQTIRQPLLILDTALRVQSTNRAFYELFQVSKEETHGRLVYELGNGQWDIPQLRTLLDAVLSEDKTFEDFEIAHEFRDIGRRSMLLNARKLSREGGREELILLAIEDITERQRAAAVIDDARIYAETIVQTIRQPLLILDIALRVQSTNRAFYELFQVSREETQGQLVYELGNGQWDIPQLRTLLDAVLSENKTFEDFEIEHDFRDIGRRSMLLNARKLSREGGREELILLAIEDITERQHAAEHREILVNELNHRVKNVMATVQAVASQTLSSATSMEEAKAAFGSRLIALGKSHDLLTRENWAGADLVDVVAETIEPHSGGLNRFWIEGPRLRLLPSAALSIAMALHELATNAAKYGALTTEEGRVDVVWRLDGSGKERRFFLRWTESDGPPVATPTRKGFGSRLVQRALAMELGGEVRVCYEPSGVVCTIDAPMPDEKGGAKGIGEPGSEAGFDRRG